MSTVLVVEDSRSQRECVSQLLLWKGINVIQACDGVEALEQIGRHSPDLVLLDIVMPRMDGYGVFRLIKANPQTRNIPVVFITGKKQHFDLFWGIKNGEAYVGKPWQPRELVDTVNRVLMDVKRLGEYASADAWCEYGVLILNMIGLYECRADAWTKYPVQILKFYEYALAAFEQALSIDSNHSLARQHQVNLRKKWDSLQEKLEQTKPCNVCQYYHGKDGFVCAVHPDGPIEKLCRDWEL